MSKKLINCKVCGCEIAKNAKVCPQCGAKNKKPIFKKWWFWTFIAILIIAICSGGDSEPATETEAFAGTVPDSTLAATNTVEEVTEGAIDSPVPETEAKVNLTTAQANALASAESYLRFSAFSYEGLISQLEFEKYEHEDAVFAADHCGADWNEQALKSAEDYLDFSAFSYKGLIEQLEFEKFTTEQATYAADNCGADWFEQAVKCAESYLEYDSFSKDGLIDQLEFEGFTAEEALYGVEANGF